MSGLDIDQLPAEAQHCASATPTLAKAVEQTRNLAPTSVSISGRTMALLVVDRSSTINKEDELATSSCERSEDGDIEKAASAKEEQSTTPLKDPNLIIWDGPDDPENPQNWTRKKKWIFTTALSSMTFCVSFSSSVFSAATQVTALEFGVSDEVMILGTALFILGFSVGPMIWGPASELYGRRVPMFTGFTIFAILQIPVALAQNVETVLVCRFLGGVFACSALVIVGGALADVWNPVDRGVAICTFSGATFIGPVAGPIAGGFITDSYLGWRWTAWLTLIMAAAFELVALFLVPESYAPLLLSHRAKKIRFETSNWAVHSANDESQINMRTILVTYLFRPVNMLFTEPILFLITIYMAFVYGIMYLFFEAYPITFQQERGWSPGLGGLPFLGITIGVILGSSIIIFMTKTRFARKMEKHGRVIPEERLPPMIIGGIMFPIGLFWFAWTSSPHITWVPQVLAGIPLGAGLLMIFMQGINYIIDVYLMYANSAIAANTLVRSLMGAGFPMFAVAMYNKLGVAWATSLLGFLTVAMVPVPVLFYVYGKKIRGWSKMSHVKM